MSDDNMTTEEKQAAHPASEQKETPAKPAPDLPAQATIMQLVDALLKTPQTLYNHVRRNDLSAHLVRLLLIFSFCLLGYGLIVGSFSGQTQWFAAPVKIFLGTCFSALLCFPSLYILAALSGADLRPGQLFGLLSSALALFGILLSGFAPVAFIFTFSIKTLSFMGFIHLLVWSISLYFGLRYIAAGLAALGSSNTAMMKIWAAIFLLTLLQMSTTMRPIIGTSDRFLTAEKKFFLNHWADSLGN
ncbi:hypothetical protein [Candidatus Electronema sp. TJ]|uniref:hypothetical protein n=1 Tax=Candidatus Electronema sp. TJ TaxID=3401573 RepID=UPI003AA8708D